MRPMRARYFATCWPQGEPQRKVWRARNPCQLNENIRSSVAVFRNLQFQAKYSKHLGKSRAQHISGRATWCCGPPTPRRNAIVVAGGFNLSAQGLDLAKAMLRTTLERLRWKGAQGGGGGQEYAHETSNAAHVSECRVTYEAAFVALHTLRDERITMSQTAPAVVRLKYIFVCRCLSVLKRWLVCTVLAIKPPTTAV